MEERVARSGSTPKLSLSATPGSESFLLQYVVEPLSGPRQTRTVRVCGELVIGRGETADLRLEGRLISRRHVLVRALYDALEVEDISTHGTLVDGASLRLGRLRTGRECQLLVGCVRVRLQRLLVVQRT
jgi:predicted component of type VI protein secretion system